MFALTNIVKKSLGPAALFIAFAVSTHIDSPLADTNKFIEGANAFKDGDLDHAIQRWSTAAENGDELAQYNIGLMNHNGMGVPKNYATALKWFAKASKNGNPMASVQMAKMFEMGNGVPKNYQMAVVLFHVGAATLPAGACREMIYERIDTLAVHLAGADLMSAIREAKQSSGLSPKSPRPWWTSEHCLSRVMLPEPATESKLEKSGDRSVATVKDIAGPPIPLDKISSATSQTKGAKNPVKFFIQVASYLGRQRALQEQTRFISRHEDVLSQMPVIIVEGQNLELGKVFRVRFGPYKNKTTAAAACDIIKKRKEACIVYEGRMQTNAARDAELTDG